MAISETLRQARLRSGVDLERLAAKTKINPRYLQAIETGNFDQLPGGIFARMFVKQYADAVGLDGASFAEEFQRTAGSGSSAPDMEPLADHRRRFHPSVLNISSVGDRVRNERLTSALSSLIWVVAAILVCATAYYGLSHWPRSSAPAASASAPAPAPVASKPVNPKPPATPVASTPEPAPSPTTPATPAAAPADSSPIQLTLNATAEVWVTAVADGKTVVSEALQPGATKIIDASQGVRLRIGNAGGLEVTYNGKKLDPFGPSGQVRTVDFTPESFQVVSRTPPNPDPDR